jgi:tRNA(Ile2) C34 agmatinyltransferase TiaS
MRVTTSSWSEVARSLGFKLKQRKPTEFKPIKCNKCGATMESHSGTNVYTCPGSVESVNKETGKTEIRPCGNYVLKNFTT